MLFTVDLDNVTNCKQT